ncbi:MULTISPECIES: PqqD family protein [Bacillus]|uniref:PqqD family protein n=1 Tax=Bacillus rugosus TaxID=2715209 RepID=A0ACD3ZX75_9BACI|nr:MULTISPECIES: PqqD family protein [Bacillus]MBY4602462.1 PqqD family protein [Bacillus sp. SPARC3]NUF07022.1 PqqD family protein [Bacillus rugosus]UPV78568.1 PqqD family protein [Bacillus rugosus]
MNIKQPNIIRNVKLTESDDEGVLLDIENGTYYGLDEVGLDIWKLIEQKKGFDDILKIISETYNSSHYEVIRDIEIFLKELKNKGLISWS